MAAQSWRPMKTPNHMRTSTLVYRLVFWISRMTTKYSFMDILCLVKEKKECLIKTEQDKRPQFKVSREPSCSCDQPWPTSFRITPDQYCIQSAFWFHDPSPPLEHFQEWSMPSLSVDVDGWMFGMNYDVTVAYGQPHCSHTGCLSVSRTTLIKETLEYNVVLKCATIHANKVSTHTSIICFEAKTVRLCLQIILWMGLTTIQRAKSSWKHRQPYQCGSSWISSICNSLRTKLWIKWSHFLDQSMTCL